MSFTKTRSRNGNSARFMYDDEVIVQYNRQDDGSWLLMFNEHDAPMKLVSTKEEAMKIFNEVSENFKAFTESSILVENLKDKLEQEEHNNTDKYRAYLESVGSSMG